LTIRLLTSAATTTA